MMTLKRNLLSCLFPLSQAVLAAGLLWFIAGESLAQVPLTGIVKIAAGSRHTCALTTGGGVKCWGANSVGQLGVNPATVFDSAVPLDVAGLASGVTALAAGGSHTCALTSGGGVKCWGLNQNGQLGDNGPATVRFTPADVFGLTSGVTAIAAGLLTTCAVTSVGGAKCWGANGVGQLGDNSTTPRPAPVDVSGLTSGVSAIATFNGHSCALTAVGGVKCWGANDSGQLGNDLTNQSLVPVDVISGPIPSGALTGASGVTVSFASSCAFTGGGVLCWGDNSGGALGNNFYPFFRHTPVSVLSGPTPAPPLAGVAAIAAGYGDVCALTNTSGIKCWGRNTSGQTGIGSNSPPTVTTPVDVIAGPALLLSGAIAVTVGDSHACALMNGGGVKCWGENGSGQLGYSGAGFYQFTPVDVQVPAIALTALQSRKTHGGVVPAFDLPVAIAPLISGLVTVEPRMIGAGHLLVFQFDAPVASLSGVTAEDSAGAPVGAVTATRSGNDVLVTLTGIADNRRAKISLTGVNGNVSVFASVGFLVGDVNSSRSVNASDIVGTKVHTGLVTDSTNFRFDLNASGAIDAFDVSAVKARSGTVLAP